MDNQYYQPGGYPPQGGAGQPMGQQGMPMGGQQGSYQPPQQLPLGYEQAFTGQTPYAGNAAFPPQQGPYGQQTGMDQSGYYSYQGMPGQADYGMPQGGMNPQGNGLPLGYGHVTPDAGAAPMSGGAMPYGGNAAPYGGNPAPYGEPGFEHKFDPNQPVMEGEAPVGFPPQQAVPQKRRPRIPVVPVIAVAALIVALVIGGSLLLPSRSGAPAYGTIGVGNLSATHAGRALVVRNEVPYDAEGMTSILYEADEGSLVTRKDAICKVYSSGYSTREMKTLQEYREQIRDYQMNLILTDNTHDAKMERLQSRIETLAREVRSLISGARGSLANQEDLLEAAVKERQEYLKQKYAADQRYSRLLDDETSQNQRIDSWTKLYKPTTEALVSFYSDGYEYGLTGENYATFEPDQVRRMINGQLPEKSTAQKGKTTIYRLVKEGEWYVLFLSDNTDWNPVKGQLYSLQLERFEDTNVVAEVVSFTRSGGELLVRLKVSSPVKPVLYLRACEAVLGENMTTLMADKKAIYKQDGMTGVVVVSNQAESFIPVNVVLYHGDYVYFQPIQQNMLYENQTVRLF